MVFLALTPVWIATLVIPVFVYLDLEEEVIEIQNLETRPVERSPRRQNETLPHRAPAITSSITSDGNNENPSSFLAAAKTQYNSVVDGSTSLLANIWGNLNTQENTMNVQIVEGRNSLRTEPEINRPADEETTNGENELPSSSKVKDTDLPTYEKLGTKRMQIGTKVIVVDKDFQVSTFSSGANV